MFSVMIIPGSKTIHLSNLQKIKHFYDGGGTVIATSALPEHSAEAGKDHDVKQLMTAMFGENAYHVPGLITASSTSNWNTGGFIPANAIDGHKETSWKPSQGNLQNEYLEIGLGGLKNVGRIRMTSPADTPFTCRVLCLNEKGGEIAVRDQVDVKLIKDGGAEAIVDLNGLATAAIRIELQTGTMDKVSISELEVLDLQNRNILSELKTFTRHTNQQKGQAYFIPAPNQMILKTVLDGTGQAWDVRFESDYRATGGNLTYLHKILNGRQIYFFANSSENSVDLPVTLKGNLKLQAWNPHTGLISELPSTPITLDGTAFTRVQLQLGAERSVFWVEAEPYQLHPEGHRRSGLNWGCPWLKKSGREDNS
jgi:hypothetical protein